MSSVVMTGRRTNERREAHALPLSRHRAARRRRWPPLPPPPPPLPTATTPTTAAAARVGRPANAHGRVRREARLSFDDHTIAIANAARDDREAARRPLDDDRALTRRVGADRPRTRTSRAAPSRSPACGTTSALSWSKRCSDVVANCPAQSRPLRCRTRLELHRAGRGIDGVVDERQLAHIDCRTPCLLHGAAPCCPGPRGPTARHRPGPRPPRVRRASPLPPVGPPLCASPPASAGRPPPFPPLPDMPARLQPLAFDRRHRGRSQRIDRRRRSRDAAGHRGHGQPAARAVLQHQRKLRRRDREADVESAAPG